LKPEFAHWNGVTFRSIELQYAKAADILSGAGSLKFGGRWNAPDSFPVIYSSTRPGTAVEEAYQLAAEFDLKRADLRPRLTCGIEWELSSVLDLTKTGLPSWIELAKWSQEDYRAINDRGFESVCQAFGRTVRSLGAAGILSASAYVDGGVNLMVFHDSLRKTDRIRLLAEDEMTKHLK
jgi:RES domain-containing protein